MPDLSFTATVPRIVVLSAQFDRHDAEICFGRYLSRLAASGLCCWEHRAYDDLAPSETAQFDLAIFCRPRFEPCPVLLESCRLHRVASVVMIDDHWIAAGEDYPERFMGLFARGDRPLEIFLEALKLADLTLVYSTRLAADLAPYSRRLLLFPLNVDFDLFAPSRPDQRPRLEAPVFGYAGSPRIFDTPAFRALARVASAHPELSVLVFSHRVPEDLRNLPPEQLHHEPFQPDYLDYAKTLGRLAPDVLLAPLDTTRAAAAKCPVKMLDCAAVGAVGVFSNVEPYRHYVRDGETGVLVEEVEAAWLVALDRLLADPALRGRIAARASAEIRARYSTDSVLPLFVALLKAVLQRDWEGLPRR